MNEVEVEVKLRTQSLPVVEAVTPVVLLIVVTHDPAPTVVGGAADDL